MYTTGNFGLLATDWVAYNQQRRETAAMRPADRAGGGRWLTSYKALMLVTEQCCGVMALHQRNAQRAFSENEIVEAIAQEIPELFAEYWESRVDVLAA